MTQIRGKKTRWRYHALFFIALIALWFTGAIGWALRPLIWKHIPKLERYYQNTYHGVAVVDDPQVGATLSISETRLRQAAKESLGWKAHLIPPRILPRRYSFSGLLKGDVPDEGEPLDIPLVIRIDPTERVPRLKLRIPSDILNDILDYDGSFTERTKRRRYFLGHYESTLWVDFDSLRILSELNPSELRKPITFRRIEGEATGTVRYRVKDSFARKTVTAKVRRMEIRCDLEFKQYLDGLSLSYDITIPELDADIKKLAPLFEEKPVETLRKRLEESLARPRKIQKVERYRLPLAVPRDLALDIEVFPSGQ